MFMEKELQADSLIIRPDRSLIASGIQGSYTFISPLCCDPISHISDQTAMQFHVTVQCCNWSAKCDCCRVGLRYSLSEKLNLPA